MNTLGKLEQLLMAGEITDEEYRERKEAYIDFFVYFIQHSQYIKS